MESLAFIQWCLDHLNYWTITLLMAIESSFIPFPSEIVVPPAAYKAAAGELNIYLVVLFATLGANIGALVNYYLAMWIGRPLIYKFASSRIGHMCLIDEASVMKAEKFFDDNGRISTFAGLPVLRIPVRRLCIRWDYGVSGILLPLLWEVWRASGDSPSGPGSKSVMSGSVRGRLLSGRGCQPHFSHLTMGMGSPQ